ncbi:MAG TPA: glycosyltransferase family 4 protein [Cyclobacteriaceae bacterium]|nr:glycosyltransferase family 4 protein [Cyclobacteriaceae bacterium]HMV09772.1 glycosyltransferase family 4 protein [Cyclobacteriaceae bacterium]HMV88781.1 glycosyltransferase family 4 protein [Cyclobacteriaceae bacterium]HMX02325.1 glycosyltransferase family 4 protein [Cyclobacteriaceae bacterium]HMX52217.1 glycosyltransferase family 4 protein [Cyclobacteriaceae bacterium]
MKVAIVLNTSWNIYNFRMNLVRSLQAGGHEVHTVAPNDEYTHHLTEAGCIHHPVRMDSRGANPVKDLALIFELHSIYKKIRPDVILHYTIKPNVYGSLAASFLKIPVVNNVCGLGTVFLKNDLLSAIAMFLYRVSFKFPRKVFFQNPDDLNLFINKKLVPSATVDLLPGSGIDLTKFHPVSFKRNEKFTFLLISRLITDKGILEYIEAVKKLRAEGLDARFQVLGAIDPEHKRGIKREIIQEWINAGIIEYLGTTKDVRHFIELADCVVLPSYREGTPRTLLEAASSSKPIVATNVPGCTQVVEDKINGLLCNLKDSDDLAAKMRAMANFDDDTLKAMGVNGRKKMEAEYDESIVIDKYLHTLSVLKDS